MYCSRIINQNGVEKLLSGLNPSKAAGPDKIPCRILKELSVELAPIFAALFSQSLNTGTLPSLWSQAFVSPIYKMGPRCMPENYRPVFLTCVSCKLFKHILCRHIRNHLDRHGILTPRSKSRIQDKTFMWDPVILTLQDLMTYRDKKRPNWYSRFRLLESVRYSSARSHVGEAGVLWHHRPSP